MALRYTEITQEMPFNVTVPVLEQSDSDGNSRMIKGLASNTEKSATGHKMTEEAIRQMKNDAEGLPLFLNHNSDVVIGNILGALQSSDSEFWIKAQLLSLTGNAVADAPVVQVNHWLDEGVNLGMSVGGSITKYAFVEDEDNDDYWFEIRGIRLAETSITPIPAVQATKGKTKKCQNNMCDQIAQMMYKEMKQTPQGDDLTKWSTHTITTSGSTSGYVQIADKNDITLEETTMADKETVTIPKEEFEGLMQSVKFLKERAEDEIKKAKEAQVKAEQDAFIQRIRAEVKEEIEDEFKQKEEAMAKAAAELVEEYMTKQAQFMVQKSEPVQESETGTSTTPIELVPEEERQEKLEEQIRDSVNYPSVFRGKVTQGYTIDQVIKMV